MAGDGEIEPRHLPAEITAGPDAGIVLDIWRKSFGE